MNIGKYLIVHFCLGYNFIVGPPNHIQNYRILVNKLLEIVLVKYLDIYVALVAGLQGVWGLYNQVNLLPKRSKVNSLPIAFILQH